MWQEAKWSHPIPSYIKDPCCVTLGILSSREGVLLTPWVWAFTVWLALATWRKQRWLCPLWGWVQEACGPTFSRVPVFTMGLSLACLLEWNGITGKNTPGIQAESILNQIPQPPAAYKQSGQITQSKQNPSLHITLNCSILRLHVTHNNSLYSIVTLYNLLNCNTLFKKIFIFLVLWVSLGK